MSSASFADMDDDIQEKFGSMLFKAEDELSDLIAFFSLFLVLVVAQSCETVVSFFSLRGPSLLIVAKRICVGQPFLRMRHKRPALLWIWRGMYVLRCRNFTLHGMGLA